MTDVLLARFLGIWIAIYAVGVLFNAKHINKAMKNIEENYGLQIFSILIPLFLGSYIVATHNHWSLHWPVLITIIGWFFLLLGTARCWFMGKFASLPINTTKWLPTQPRQERGKPAVANALPE